jgi:hypothetical protein
MNKKAILVAITTGMLFGSTLEVYKDKIFYTYEPQNDFIGISQILRAVCDGTPVDIVRTRTCPEDHAMCKHYNERNLLRNEHSAVRKRIEMLDAFANGVRPSAVETKRWIEASQTLASEFAQLEEKSQRLSFDIARYDSMLKKETNAPDPAALEHRCNGTLHLTLPGNGIGFNVRYRAELDEKSERMRIMQILEITNRSGVDIEATHARFFNENASKYLSIPHFSPKILRERPPVIAYRHAKAVTADVAVAAPIQKRTAPTVTKRTRTYDIAPLSLPSDGKTRRFELETYETKTVCRNELHAYQSREAVSVCRFAPKSEIESGVWQVRQNGKILNESARGRYENGKYALYVKTVRSLKVRKLPYIPKKKEDGFFETVIRKKEGTILTLTNVSDKPLDIRVFERIPVSASDKIKVTSLSLKGVEKYETDKRGKLSFDVKLKPSQTRTIEITYIIEHDKDVEVY